MALQQKRCELEEQGCGGCDLLSLPYEKQLQKKQKELKALLGKFRKLQPILGTEEPWHYRNKVISTFTYHERKLDSGIYIQGTHKVLPVKSCLLHQPALDEAVEAVRQAARVCKYKPYDEDRHTGLLRHVLARHSLLTDEVMVVLVTASPVLAGAKNFVKEVRRRCPKVSTIIQNINPRATSAVLGYQEKILCGRGYIEDELCGVRFQIAASSFYQVNPKQTEVLYQTAISAAKLDGSQSVLDAYCGVGTIGLTAAGKARSVLGVELNKKAVQCALENARKNGIKNARFLCEDATKFIQKMADRGEHVDVVFMDPPRAGSTPEFLDAVSRMKPDSIVYISCNPETLKRDLEILVKKDWKVEMIQGVDLFPGTKHVETVVLLGRKKSTEDMVYAYVDYEPEDDTYLHGMKGNATYREIKEWIKAEYGMSVSSLYVAQIKDKCGFEKRQNYNIGENKAHVPNCPPEKEKAILKAFKHFRMI